MGAIGKNNYRFCIGNYLRNNNDQHAARAWGGDLIDGLFGTYTNFGLDDCIDGTSSTIARGERCKGIGPTPAGNREIISAYALVSGLTGLLADQPTDAAMCRTVRDPLKRTHFTVMEDDSAMGGARWCDGRPFFSGMTTLLPPNAPACKVDRGDWQWGLWTPSSRHTASALFCLADGSVHAISQDIDDGIFRALGTKAGRETIDAEDFEN